MSAVCAPAACRCFSNYLNGHAGFLVGQSTDPHTPLVSAAAATLPRSVPHPLAQPLLQFQTRLSSYRFLSAGCVPACPFCLMPCRGPEPT